MRYILLAAICGLSLLGTAVADPPVDYDIVYVRQPRYGDNDNTTWPEIFHPGRIDPGADLVLLHPDGTQETLVAGGNGSVTDPFVSFDGQWIYYSLFYDVQPDNLNYQREYLSYAGADIFRIHVTTREIEQLTFGEFTPHTGAGIWDESNPVDPPPEFNRLGYGIMNLGPCPVPGGKVAFTSNRNGLTPPRPYTAPTLQLFVMDEDGENVTQIAPMNIGSALHPTPLRDGRIMFSSYESQGLRDIRLWGIWAIWPDGRLWSPIISAFRGAQAFHFMTQMGNGDMIVVDYYNLNNNGFGAMYRFPESPPDGTPRFYSAFPDDNPPIDQTVGQGFSYPFKMPFTPWGMYSTTPFTHGNDEAAPVGDDGVRVGKFTHPSAAPDNALLCVRTPGPANDLDRPTPLPYYDAGIYLLPDGVIPDSPDDLIEIKNDPAYNEAWPRAVVPYSAVHGIDAPPELPGLPNDGSVHDELPAGTPYGLVGTSSFYKRESFPGYVTPWSDTFDGLDAFNTAENEQSSNWGTQGSDAGKYSNSDIWAVRLLAMEPHSHRSYGPHEGIHFVNHANERLRILGEIPLRKFNGDGTPVLDPEGNPDTSFIAKIPADTPFTFQMLDQDGRVLTMAQTWLQVRPGEIRVNCGGCHAHSQLPLAFEETAAGQPGFPVVDLVAQTPLLTKDENGDPDIISVDAPVVNVEFYQDIRPILQSKCVGCHTQDDPEPPGNLVLDDLELYNGLPGDYKRLADDNYPAQWGYPSLIDIGFGPLWRQTNASRYIRAFQSRRSLLIWKIFGERSDGWTNDDHPTETVPGDVDTLPEGADPNAADIDFTGTIMPPPDSGVDPLTDDEKITFARWIDLGCPINVGEEYGEGDWGWFLDDLKPTVEVSLPRAGANVGPLNLIRVGVADAYTGIDTATLSITADIELEGRAPGEELADLAQPDGEDIYSITLTEPLTDVSEAHVLVTVEDFQGNITRVNRRFSVTAPEPCDADMNCDDVVDSSDVAPFVLAVIDPAAYAAAYPDCDPMCGDMNGDGWLDGEDIQGFVAVIGGP